MARKIKYKALSKELEEIVKPISNLSSRVSVGLDQHIGEYYFINIDQLNPFRNQARIIFNNEEITKLADSIREYGIRQPLTVINNIDGRYEVVSGERRLRAAKEAGLTKVPCIVLKNDINTNAIALIENLHRKDLHPIELGLIYKKLIEEKIFENQEKLAQAISISKSIVSEYIKFSGIPEHIKKHILEKNISTKEKLRDILEAYEENKLKKLDVLIGLTKAKSKNFSILRIFSAEGEIKIQQSGLDKLPKSARSEVKDRLQNLLQQMDQVE